MIQLQSDDAWKSPIQVNSSKLTLLSAILWNLITKRTQPIMHRFLVLRSYCATLLRLLDTGLAGSVTQLECKRRPIVSIHESRSDKSQSGMRKANSTHCGISGCEIRPEYERAFNTEALGWLQVTNADHMQTCKVGSDRPGQEVQQPICSLKIPWRLSPAWRHGTQYIHAILHAHINRKRLNFNIKKIKKSNRSTNGPRPQTPHQSSYRPTVESSFLETPAVPGYGCEQLNNFEQPFNLSKSEAFVALQT